MSRSINTEKEYTEKISFRDIAWEYDGKVAYHTTEKENLNNILNRGIRATEDKNFPYEKYDTKMTKWDLEKIEDKGVFFFDESESAIKWGANMENPVILVSQMPEDYMYDPIGLSLYMDNKSRESIFEGDNLRLDIQSQMDDILRKIQDEAYMRSIEEEIPYSELAPTLAFMSLNQIRPNDIMCYCTTQNFLRSELSDWECRCKEKIIF